MRDDRPVEARQATLLFCDLVQSTRLATQVDLEDLRAIFRSFWNIVADVAQRHNGYVTRFVGDGAFASFGYPQAREDAAEMAVRAARELVTGVRGMHTGTGASLDVRVGIASGTVAVGELIERAMVYEEAVIGTVPHLAARLLAEAPPGGIVVSDATFQQVGRYFEYQDLGRLDLRGFPKPERAWLVIGETGIASRFEASAAAGEQPHVVGRAQTLARIHQEWRGACDGRRCALTLSGDPGIGKSCLANALSEAVKRDGAAVVRLDCVERASLTPLHPLTVWLRKWCGITPFEDEAAQRQKLAKAVSDVFDTASSAGARNGLGRLLMIDGPPSDISADLERTQNIALLVELLHRIATDRPALIVCEDFQWVDASTQLLLQQVLKSPGNARVMVLATRRTGAAGDPPVLPDATDLALEPLPGTEALELVRLACRGRSLDEAVLASIVERGEGVPLYLEELARHATEWSERAQGEASDAATTGAPPAADLPHIPARVQALIQARLAQLPHVKPLAQAAAVIGREFTRALLDELMGERRAEVPSAIARLMEAGVLAAASDPSDHTPLRFRHALIHDAVYQTLLRNERRRLHGKVADLLQERFRGQSDAAQDVVGHHLAAAGRVDEALHFLLSASEGTAARAAYVESIGHARSGLAMVDKVADVRIRATAKLELTTRLALGLAATQGYAAPSVETAYRQARELCSDDADPAKLFGVVRGMATFYIVRCQLATADADAELCMALAERSGQPELIIEALTARGYCKVYLGQLEAGRAALDRCVELYRQHAGREFRYPSAQDPAVASWSLLANVSWLQGDAENSELYLRSVLAHAEELGRPFDRAYANCYAAKLRNLQGRPDEAIQHANQCVALSTKHGLNTWLAAGTMQAAVGMATGANPAEGAATLRHVLDLFIAAGAELNAPYFLWGLASGLLAQGNADGAGEAIDDGLRRCDATGEVYLKPQLLLLAAQIASAGRPVEARRLRTEALELAGRYGAHELARKARLALA